MRPYLAIIALLITSIAFSQKPNINKAKAALDKGELAEAKTIIDQAIDYEKTKDKPKTWYYRGMIYATLDTANNEPKAMEVAMEAFNKTLELDPEQKAVNEFTATGITNVDSRIQGYYAYYYNNAIEYYQDEDFATAASNFEKAAFIMPSDTNSIINAAYASSAAEDTERAKANFNKALEAGMKDKNIYLRLYNYAVTEEKMEEALAVIRKGREVFPDDVDLQKYEINILIQLDKVDEAKAGIQEAIEKEPNNADLHFSLGVINEESGDIDGARISYENALKADPNHFNSQFNVGVMEFNQCNELIKERNGLGYREETKYKELTTKIDNQLKVTLPYWEKLYSIKGTDQTVLETLQYIYTMLKMNDKAEKIGKELEAVKG